MYDGPPDVEVLACSADTIGTTIVTLVGTRVDVVLASKEDALHWIDLELVERLDSLVARVLEGEPCCDGQESFPMLKRRLCDLHMHPDQSA